MALAAKLLDLTVTIKCRKSNCNIIIVRRNNRNIIITRPGVDKVKPKVWFKFFL